MVCNCRIKSRILFLAPRILVLNYLQAARLEILLAYVHLYTHSLKKEVTERQGLVNEMEIATNNCEMLHKKL